MLLLISKYILYQIHIVFPEATGLISKSMRDT